MTQRVKKRNICVVITDRAQLSRLVTLLRELKSSPAFNLQIVVGAGALTYRYGNVLNELKREGFSPNVSIPTVIEGEDPLVMAKTAGLGMIEFATAFNSLNCDMVVARGDRFEMLPIAAAAVYLNKILVHLEGGDRTGSIDDSVRHAITKLAHIHFATNSEARKRVIKLGEPADMVFNAGSLDIDFLTKIKLSGRPDSKIVNNHGVGATIDLSDKYVVVMQNPVTTEMHLARKQAAETLSAIHNMRVPAVWVWPGLGSGSDAIAKKMREWQNARFGRHNIRFVRYISPPDFVNILNRAAAVIGNSSAGIKECGWLGVPVVNIGTRQADRAKGRNVVEVDFERGQIKQAVERQMRHKRYAKSRLYGDGSTARRIVKILSKLDPARQKRITY